MAQINALREQKIDLLRQAQEAAGKAYRARADAEAAQKKRAADRREQSMTSAVLDQRAMLESMLSLSSDKAAVEQDVDAAEEAELIANAEAEEAGFRKLVAAIELEIADLTGEKDRQEAAIESAVVATTVEAEAAALKTAAQRERSEALSKTADTAVKEANSKTQDAKKLREKSVVLEAEARAAVSVAEGSDAEVDLSKPLAGPIVDLDGMVGELEEVTKDINMLFKASFSKIESDEKNQLDAEIRWAEKVRDDFTARLRAIDTEERLEAIKNRVYNKAQDLIEAAKRAGIKDPFRATEQDVKKAESAMRARKKEERRLVDEAIERLARSAPSMSNMFAQIMQKDMTAATDGLATVGDPFGGAAWEDSVSLANKPKGDDMDGWETTMAMTATMKARAAEAATAEYDEALEAVAEAIAAGEAEEVVLELELAARELKRGVRLAAAEAATARRAVLKMAQETQAGKVQAASIAVQAARVLNYDSYVATQAAQEAVKEAAAAIEKAKAAAMTADASASLDQLNRSFEEMVSSFEFDAERDRERLQGLTAAFGDASEDEGGGESMW